MPVQAHWVCVWGGRGCVRTGMGGGEGGKYWWEVGGMCGSGGEPHSCLTLSVLTDLNPGKGVHDVWFLWHFQTPTSAFLMMVPGTAVI